MTDVNLEKLNLMLLRCLKLVSATGRLFKDCGLELPNLVNLERELRESLKEIQDQVMEKAREANRPLLGDPPGG